MKFCRFHRLDLPSRETVDLKGVIDGDTIRRIHGSIFRGYNISLETYHTDEIAFIPPILPYTVTCLLPNGAGYIKSLGSISQKLDGADHTATVTSNGSVYCTPRIALVVEPKNRQQIFGITPMLDFSPKADFTSMESSSPNYTVLGKAIDTEIEKVNELSFIYNGDTKTVHPISMGDLTDVVSAHLKRYTHYTGDIIATYICPPILCKPGDIVSISLGGQQLTAHIA